MLQKQNWLKNALWLLVFTYLLSGIDVLFGTFVAIFISASILLYGFYNLCALIRFQDVSRHHYLLNVAVCGSICYLGVTLDNKNSVMFESLAFLIPLGFGVLVFWKRKFIAKHPIFLNLYIAFALFMVLFYLSGEFYSFLSKINKQHSLIALYLFPTGPLFVVAWKLQLVEKQKLQRLGLGYLIYYFVLTPMGVLAQQGKFNLNPWVNFTMFIASAAFLIVPYFFFGDFGSYWRNVIFGRIFVVIFFVLMFIRSLGYLPGEILNGVLSLLLPFSVSKSTALAFAMGFLGLNSILFLWYAGFLTYSVGLKVINKLKAYAASVLASTEGLQNGMSFLSG